MKEKRNLSGIYVRYKNPDGTMDNRCFEDLPKEAQETFLKGKDPEWINHLVYALANTLNNIGDQLDIFKE